MKSQPYKPSDFSAAFFATGNVAIARRRLAEVTEPGEVREDRETPSSPQI